MPGYADIDTFIYSKGYPANFKEKANVSIYAKFDAPIF